MRSRSKSFDELPVIIDTLNSIVCSAICSLEIVKVEQFEFEETDLMTGDEGWIRIDRGVDRRRNVVLIVGIWISLTVDSSSL